MGCVVRVTYYIIEVKYMLMRKKKMQFQGNTGWCIVILFRGGKKVNQDSQCNINARVMYTMLLSGFC